MSYNPINWQNDKIGGTKVNATNLNIMDKGIADAHNMLADHDKKINDFANEQIPEEYVKESVDNYIAENQAGIASKEEVSAVAENVNRLSSEIVEVQRDLDNLGYKNLADVELINGEYVEAQLNGQVVSDGSFKRTDYIPLFSSMKELIVLNTFVYGNDGIAFYDENKNFINGYFNNETKGNYVVIDIPNNAKYFRISGLNTDSLSVYYNDVFSSIESLLLSKASKEELQTEKTEIEKQISEKKSIVDYSQFGLPTLFLKGDTEGMSKDNKKTLNYVFKDNKGTCSVKWQGSSSLNYPKKNYTITFDKDFILGDRWGKQKKYCFKANWIDFSHARNVVCAKLWGEIVRDRHKDLSDLYCENGNTLTTESGENLRGYEDEFLRLPNGGAIDGFPCVIYLNDEFLGLYSCNIPKDKWMLNMGKTKTEYMVTAERNSSEATLFRGLTELDGSDFELEYKDDSVPLDTVKTSLNNMITAINNCNSTSSFNSLNMYLDLDTALDYYIFTILIGAIDCVSKNYILATYDGTRWFHVAYDLDTTFGIHWNGGSYYSYGVRPTIDSYSSPESTENLLGWLFKNWGKDKLKERYNYLVNGIMSEDNIYQMFNNYLANIPLAVKVADNELWKTIPNTTTNNVAQIINYYHMRVAIITKQIENL